jgi:hypothetical protein
MASELGQISELDHSTFPAEFPPDGSYYNQELPVAFQDANFANVTNDSTYFTTNPPAQDSELAFDDYMQQPPTGFSAGTELGWHFNALGSGVYLNNFPSYPGSGDNA